ncbi:MAG: hypothetical protein OXH52_04600, partial [Gammaproteobacteria bacterium]|nr:hypothetical protein [Gammaproteobacteria bacterium]
MQLQSGRGVRVVDKHFDDPHGIDAFISPRSAHGLLIQLGQTPGPLNNPPYWEAEATGLHGSTHPATGQSQHFLTRQRSGNIPRLKAP